MIYPDTKTKQVLRPQLINVTSNTEKDVIDYIMHLLYYSFLKHDYATFIMVRILSMLPTTIPCTWSASGATCGAASLWLTYHCATQYCHFRRSCNIQNEDVRYWPIRSAYTHVSHRLQIYSVFIRFLKSCCKEFETVVAPLQSVATTQWCQNPETDVSTAHQCSLVWLHGLQQCCLVLLKSLFTNTELWHSKILTAKL